MTTTMHQQFQTLLERDSDQECERSGSGQVCARLVSMAELPSRFGDFHILAFENNRDGKEHVAITRGNVIEAEDVPVRLHSECLTGDALGSLRCDCRDQLESALRAIGQMERGMVIYLRQEGRGIGLANKIRAYSLQDKGLDTVQANLALGFRDDERDYAVAAQMLMSLRIKSVRLMTNNPNKIKQLTRYGIRVNGRIPHVMQPNEYNRFYLETKAAKSGHLMDFQAHGHFAGQGDQPFAEGVQPEKLEAFHD